MSPFLETLKMTSVAKQGMQDVSRSDDEKAQ